MPGKEYEVNAQPQPNDMSQEIERELARRLDVAQAQRQPAELMIAGNRYRLVPVADAIQTPEQVELARRNLHKQFGSVTPRHRPEDFASLREEFARGAAEDALTRGQP